MKADGAETRAWTVVLRPDGVVDDVQGGAPIHWLGRTLLETGDVPQVIRSAAIAVLSYNRGLHWLKHERAWTAVNGHQVAVDLVVCDAVPLRRSLVVVRDVVMRVLELFRQQAPDTAVEVHLDYSEAVPLTFAIDGEKITWAISTLVGTALRHIRTDRPHAPGRISILLDYEIEVNELIIRVSDNGPGISPERRRWLFERDPNTGRSTGLALVMVRDVILAHQGSIDVGARPGGGTSITLRLPRPAER
jgi:signal transduction histidine kinase